MQLIRTLLLTTGRSIKAPFCVEFIHSFLVFMLCFAIVVSAVHVPVVAISIV